MAAVMVNIAGRSYRLSCDDGEEPRLLQLARYVEDKILSMQDSFKEIGEQRIVVMAALAIADESTDSRGKVETLTQEAAALRAELETAQKTIAALEERASQAVEDAARRLEQLSADLQKQAPRDEFPI